MTAKLNLDEPVQMAWNQPAQKGSCGRNPAAGPGSCHYWWEGCPRAEKRGCYYIWVQAQIDAGNMPDDPQDGVGQ